MKTNKFLLIVISIFIVSLANAQVKKKVIKKTTTTVTPKPVTNQGNVQNTSANNVNAETKTELSNTKVEDHNKSQLPSSKSTAKSETQIDNPYKAAIGIKFLWGISITGKYFLKPHQALEAIIRYKGYQGIGNDLAFSALYEYERQIPGADGFNWYAGAGAYFGHFSYKSSYDLGLYGIKTSKSYYGVSGVVGLEYKIKQLPIAISADWMPSFDIKGGAFVAENGGIGVKYAF
ncbi:hypothetical protein [Pedobacter sp. ASV28]|uniref:hypothetical protein n=1 Tax=Pedobacter sp. ASV28 TaxID=2795123 RepID=UPI0018EBD878|nr:hypothetical protein [Pedobacter sp. ASV28]